MLILRDRVCNDLLRISTMAGRSKQIVTLDGDCGPGRVEFLGKRSLGLLEARKGLGGHSRLDRNMGTNILGLPRSQDIMRCPSIALHRTMSLKREMGLVDGSSSLIWRRLSEGMAITPTSTQVRIPLLSTEKAILSLAKAKVRRGNARYVLIRHFGRLTGALGDLVILEIKGESRVGSSTLGVFHMLGQARVGTGTGCKVHAVVQHLGMLAEVPERRSRRGPMIVRGREARDSITRALALHLLVEVLVRMTARLSRSHAEPVVRALDLLRWATVEVARMI